MRNIKNQKNHSERAQQTRTCFDEIYRTSLQDKVFQTKKKKFYIVFNQITLILLKLILFLK